MWELLNIHWMLRIDKIIKWFLLNSTIKNSRLIIYIGRNYNNIGTKYLIKLKYGNKLI